MVVVGQVKKFGLQHSITVKVWDDSGKEHSCPGRFQVSSYIYLNLLFIIFPKTKKDLVVLSQQCCLFCLLKS